VARWELEAPRVLRLAGGAAPEPVPDAADVPSALRRGSDGGPGIPDPTIGAAAVRVEVPHDFAPLLYQDPERARAWRLAVREAMTAYVGRGYRADRFVDGAYLLHAAI
jgi:predicted GNAT superfamily acetyltransferase